MKDQVHFLSLCPIQAILLLNKNPACCVMRTKQVQIPKAGSFFQNITELLPSVPECETCRTMGRKVLAEEKPDWG